MRFGGLLFQKWSTPEEWAQIALEAGYSAVYFPVHYDAPQKEIDGYLQAARDADLVISEIGVWKNTLDLQKERREEAISYAIHQLELADYAHARCCVNISGSYHPTRWDGPHPAHFTQRVFEDVVAVTQRIIDAAKPRNTAYTLEPMPWMIPETPESYLRLIKAVDRKAFAAHIDMVNVICSPALYYCTGDVIRDWFDKLGPYIRSCHAKDIVLRDTLTVHLDECRPGTGHLDYEAYLSCARKLDPDTCMMLEHMTEEQDYVKATQYIKGIAARLGIQL